MSTSPSAGMPAAAPQPAAEPSAEDALLWLLARQARRVPLPVFLSALLLSAMASGSVPAWPVVAWLVLVGLVLAVRWTVLGRLPTLAHVAHARRLRVAAALSGLNGLAHGLSLGFFPYFDELERAVQSILLLGLCAGSVATTAGYMPVFLAFVLPTLLPLCLLWAIGTNAAPNGWIEGSTAVLIALFGIVLVALARDTFRSFAESFEIRRQQAELNGRLQAALEEVQAASRAKTRFLASASHDLRQPLHTLTLFGAALAMRPLDEASRRIAEHMGAALQSLGAQLDALLDISKLDAGIVSVRPSVFSLARFTQRLADEFRPAAERKGLALQVRTPPEAVCETDEALLTRIVRNLLDNAIKYTASGTVAIELHAADDALSLQVVDSGIGIEPTEQARVFEEFYQVGNPERDRSRGLGLGLSIVRRLVDLLELELRMDSVPRQGTRISLGLRPARSGVVNEQRAAPAPRIEGLLVLVLDDEEAVRQGMRTLLEGHGCQVRLAGGLHEAVAQVRHDRPHIVLADLRLRAGENGIAAVEALRSLHPGLPALLISGDTAPDRLQEAHAAGIRLLHKPVPADALRHAIEQEVHARNAPGSTAHAGI